MMPETLLLAAVIAFAGAGALALGLAAFDRWAPAHMVQERHDLALAVMIALPLIFVLALQPRPATDMVEFLPAADMLDVANNAEPVMGRPGTVAPVANLETAPRWQRFPLAEIVIVTWLIGMMFAVLRLVWDGVALLRLRWSSRAITLPEGLVLSHRVAIRRSPQIASPMLAGYIRPAIYLPEAFVLTPEARAVLEHEIAHLKRGDAWTVLALRVLRLVFWWALPLRQVEHLLEHNREALCDAEAARITGQPVALAHALLDAAEQNLRRPSLALAAGAGRSSLARRVRHLASSEILQQRSTPMRLVYIAPVLALAAFVATPKVGAEIDRDRDERFDLSRDLPLYQAARRGRISEIAALIDAGADPDEISPGDGSPLFAAIRTGQDDVVDYLLSRGADPDLEVRGDGSPMIEAARRGQPDMLDRLIAAGGTLDAGVVGDGNPLIAAVQAGEVETVAYLLDAGADPNAYIWADETPMIAAAQNNEVEIAAMLADAGADVSLTVLAPTMDGEVYRSPLSEAERLRNRRMAQWLRSQGAQHQPPAE